MSKNPYVLLLVALVLFACDGCKPNQPPGTVRVQGNVTVAGRPLPADAEANITFSPTSLSQPGGSAASIRDGRYIALAVPKGKVLVTFIVMQPTGQEKAFEPGARAQMEMRSLVPAAKSNGIEMDVSEGQLTINFDL